MGQDEDRSAPAPRAAVVELRAADVLGVAELTRTKADELVKDNQFKNLHLSEDVFGGIRSARALVHLHGSAHQVVSDTINEVSAQLTAYADGLSRSVSDLVDIETDSGKALDILAIRSLGQVRGGDMGEAARREAESKYAPETKGEVPGVGDPSGTSTGTED
jgi:hypothetical protein